MIKIKLKNFITGPRTKYFENVQKYLREYGFIIVQRLYSKSIGNFELDNKSIQEILGDNYPKAYWIKRNEHIQQFISILKVGGYKTSGNINTVEEKDICGWCGAIIQNHLKMYGDGILENMTKICKTTNGRITYFQMLKVLGFSICNCERSDDKNMKACVILYLRETNIPFKYDETYIYLP